MGGGGGNSQTTTSGIDPEFKPYLKEVLSDVTGKYKESVAAGPDATVAPLAKHTPVSYTHLTLPTTYSV